MPFGTADGWVWRACVECLTTTNGEVPGLLLLRRLRTNDNVSRVDDGRARSGPAKLPWNGIPASLPPREPLRNFPFRGATGTATRLLCCRHRPWTHTNTQKRQEHSHLSGELHAKATKTHPNLVPSKRSPPPAQHLPLAASTRPPTHRRGVARGIARQNTLRCRGRAVLVAPATPSRSSRVHFQVQLPEVKRPPGGLSVEES